MRSAAHRLIAGLITGRLHNTKNKSALHSRQSVVRRTHRPASYRTAELQLHTTAVYRLNARAGRAFVCERMWPGIDFTVITCHRNTRVTHTKFLCTARTISFVALSSVVRWPRRCRSLASVCWPSAQSARARTSIHSHLSKLYTKRCTGRPMRCHQSASHSPNICAHLAL